MEAMKESIMRGLESPEISEIVGRITARGAEMFSMYPNKTIPIWFDCLKQACVELYPEYC
jgi:hypothetical protein